MDNTFTKADFGKNRFPQETGAYTCAIISRDGEIVLRTLYYIRDDEYSGSWARAEISEYGYYSFSRIDADYIHAYKKIEGVEVSVVPEQLNIKVQGVSLDDD